MLQHKGLSAMGNRCLGRVWWSTEKIFTEVGETPSPGQNPTHEVWGPSTDNGLAFTVRPPRVWGTIPALLWTCLQWMHHLEGNAIWIMHPQTWPCSCACLHSEHSPGASTETPEIGCHGRSAFLTLTQGFCTAASLCPFPSLWAHKKAAALAVRWFSCHLTLAAAASWGEMELGSRHLPLCSAHTMQPVIFLGCCLHTGLLTSWTTSTLGSTTGAARMSFCGWSLMEMLIN